MKPWSDSPIHESFVLKIFCDTMILAYLIDHTYESLNKLINSLAKCSFVEIVSSRFVIFEFAGIRKREHYFRLAAATPLSPPKQVNLTSLARYLDKFDSPDVEFSTLTSQIENAVNSEIMNILEDYKINFEYSSFNTDQFRPTIDVCLGSKIANQDSLVLISSAIPSEGDFRKDVLLLTNDDPFLKAGKTEEVTSILEKWKIKVDLISFVSCKFLENGAQINLTQDSIDEEIEQFVKEQTLTVIKFRLKNYYLGKTIVPTNSSIPKNIICFRIAPEVPIKNSVFITIIDKDLDFIYTSKVKILEFRHSASILPEGHSFTRDQLRNIAFKMHDVDDENNEIQIDDEILDEFRKEGNLIFIHPDSF